MNDDRSKPARITVYATPYCGDTRRARRVLDELQIEYDFVDIRVDQDAARWVEQVNNGFRSSPTIAFPDGTTLTEPSERVLRAKLEHWPAPSA
ncbi:MAG: glutathione S-transferase N-terminal domain-containing protein [Anaerolineae bacterium]|nr:glutathione S-transferase N-terminal domain-containing protein [Anaerolineae bacterium]MCB0199737.1 glutathione S-transferase N-terminal domain-containing protein [Anaerolineae bacterium]MCB0204317.1 glutathione S-transferase N-terminal domain-containing protein [Anaerolineae bacterium]MCB0253760.1 glutathione S-transferase N-terminal domain-containing protein [Anaerolineae bacterium]